MKRAAVAVSNYTASGSAPGYDIILIGGQSNQFYGLTKDGGIDTSDANVYQFYSGGAGTADTVSLGGANDPLDHPDTSGVAGPAIGHTVRFAVDSYIGGGNLLTPRKVLLVPTAYGGTRVGNTGALGWGVNSGRGGAATVGTLATSLVSRANAAKALSGTNTIKLLDWHQGEGDIYAFATLQLPVITKYRWMLLTTLKYFRDQIGGNFPIVLGTLADWTSNTGDGVNYLAANAKLINKVIRAIARKLPYVAVVDTISPSPVADGSSVHYTAAGQRATYAPRLGVAYDEAVANSNYPTSPTWDDIDYRNTADGYAAGCTITNGGLDLTGDANAGWKTHIATMPNTSGLVYWEMKAQAVASATNLGYVGVCNQDFSTEGYLGQSSSNSGRHEAAAGLWGLAGQASSVTGAVNSPWTLRAALTLASNIAVNGRVMLALNRSLGYLWIGVNGTWPNGGDPAAGTNPWITGIPTTDLVFIAASIYTGTGNTWRIQAKASEQSYLPPSGFTAWGS